MSEEKMRSEYEKWLKDNFLVEFPTDPLHKNQISYPYEAWQAAYAHKKSEFSKEREQLRALIAMQAEALKEAERLLSYGRTRDMALKALSTSSESVAAWESEKLEPLRREVAMLREKVHHGIGCAKVRYSYDYKCNCGVDEVLNNTQATAEAYERELKAKVLEEAADRVASFCGCDIPLRKLAAELRAQSA